MWHTSFTDSNELMQCCKQSLHIPLLCPRIERKDKLEIVDGAFCFVGEDLPNGDDTLYIGTVPEADVYIPVKFCETIFPSLNEKKDSMYQRGYNSFMEWYHTDVYKKKVGVRTANHFIQCILWILKSIEIFFKRK
jgi:hypothetical protein